MAYIIQVSCDIRDDQMTELEMGSALQRVLGYLRTLLPNEQGYVESRAMISLDVVEARHLVFQSVWRTWEDLVTHRETSLDEAKVLREFQPHVTDAHLTVHIFEEVD